MKSQVNAAGRPERKRGVWAAAILLLLCASRPAVAGTVEQVRFRTGDGLSVVADYYRPEATSSRAALLLADAGATRDAWRPLAEALAARGFHVLAPDLRGQGDSDAPPLRRGSADVRGAGQADWWRDGLAAAAFLRARTGDSLTALAWCGAGAGGAAVVLAASRDAVQPAAFLLLSPDSLLGRATITPLLAATPAPFLLLAAREDLPTAEAARDLYLRTGTRGMLWELENADRGTRLLVLHPALPADLADWLAAVVPDIPPARTASP